MPHDCAWQNASKAQRAFANGLLEAMTQAERNLWGATILRNAHLLPRTKAQRAAWDYAGFLALIESA